jgi:O-antigen/teichoic acid export membrane protein
MSQKHKLIGNSLSMLVNRITQGIATFVLSAAIARTLGAYALGQYLLAISYYYIFVNLTSQGFKTLFTREIAREPQLTPIYLVSGTLLQLIFSIVGYLALVLTIYLLPYSADTSLVCCILGLTIIPFSLSNITESIFQAQEKMHLIAISTVPIYILRLLAMLWYMQVFQKIEYVAIILVISESIILLIEWLIIVNIIKPKWQLDRAFMWKIVKTAKTLFAIEGIGMIAAKIDVLILSLLGSEVLVGLYGSVMQLIQPFFIISNSLTLAAFPGMSKAVAIGREQQRTEAENIINILLCMGIPFLMGMIFYGNDLLLFIYQKPSFLEASAILNLVSVAIVISTCAQSLSYVLIANGLERFNLIEVVLTSITGGCVGILMISQYKLLGAAYMSLAMSITSFSAIGYAVHRRIFSLRLWPLLRLPLLISSFMLIVFLVLKQINTNLLLSLILATGAYTILVSALLVRELGGLQDVRKRISNFKF